MARSVLQSIRDGLTRRQLMEKYGLSPLGLRKILRQIRDERDRRACQIIQDFLWGIEVKNIAIRNGFPAERFFYILRRVVFLQLCRPYDLTARTERTSFQDANRERRRYPRVQFPVLAPHVRDVSRPRTEGTILDICEKGIGVEGIVADVHDEKTFLIEERNFDLPDPIVLTCKCRWTGEVLHPGSGQFAGFEIIGISEADDRCLRSWLDAEARMTSWQQFVGA